jgi:hypothetical protein
LNVLSLSHSLSLSLSRMLTSTLPWPTWRADLAPDYTLFMPVNYRSSTIYQNQIPTLRPETEDNNPAPAPATTPQPPVTPNILSPNTASSQQANAIELAPFNNMSHTTIPDIENRHRTSSNDTNNGNNRSTNNTNRAPSSSTSSSSGGLAFFTSIFSRHPDYQSINNGSSHHSTDNLISDQERQPGPVSPSGTLRIPLTTSSTSGGSSPHPPPPSSVHNVLHNNF